MKVANEIELHPHAQQRMKARRAKMKEVKETVALKLVISVVAEYF